MVFSQGILQFFKVERKYTLLRKRTFFMHVLKLNIDGEYNNMNSFFRPALLSESSYLISLHWVVNIYFSHVAFLVKKEKTGVLVE